MLFYFHGGDLPGFVIAVTLFITIVPLSASIVIFFVIRDFLKWKKSNSEKNNKS